MVNPYDPQSPANPDYFGGRKHILSAVLERLEKAKVKKQSGGVLVYGYRGVGKTSLLNKVSSTIQPQDELPGDVLVVYRRLSTTTSVSEFYQVLTESLVDELERRKTFVERLKSLGKNISSVKLFSTVEFQREREDAERTPFLRWKGLLRGLSEVSCIVVEIDDADYLSPEALGELKTIAEETSLPPILLIVSGAIDFEERLVDDYSPIARIFSGASFDLGEFKLDETQEVLEKPVAGSGTRWTEDAINAVQKLSGGYPYLVQCLASASYFEDTIEKSRVEEHVADALEIGKPWLSHELGTASDNDIRSFERIVKSGKPSLRSSEISALGVSPPYIGRLVKLKVLKFVSYGRYNLIMPPIVCYYHILKRNLQKEE
ncbi:MAG: ATP-binding protein [Candidatus Micrarchaeia archaeon]